MTQELQQFWPHDLVAGEAVNVRPGDEDVSDLLGSIAAHGLLQPLVGRSLPDGTVEIIDGNRRLKALKQLFDEERLREKVPVMLRDQEADADAFEISLAANVLRRQLHPVAEFEAFAALIDKGKDKQAVADHFGIPLRAVEQRLALGRLHQEVRAAWLEGRINGEAARAFTLAAPAEQATYLFKVTYPHELRADSIRRAFTKETVPASSGIARYVGVETYRNAGGTFVPDLFAEEPDFADGKLLNFLADQLLQAKAEDLRETEGWGEVLFGEAASEKWRWHRIPKSVPCMVVIVDAAEQAEAFAEINTHQLAVTGAVLHKSRVVAGNGKAVQLQAICDKAGCRIVTPRAQSELKRGDTFAAATLYKMMESFSTETLQRALEAIIQAGDGHIGLVRANVVSAYCALFEARLDLRDHPGLIDALDDFDLQEAFVSMQRSQLNRGQHRWRMLADEVEIFLEKRLRLPRAAA